VQIQGVRFSGHQSFTLRNTWLTKGVLGCHDDPALFRADDAMVSLGVGKNMVDAIKYWCLATQMVQDHPEERWSLQPTDIGKLLFIDGDGWDRYLEDVGSLWLVHWLLATNPAQATTIFYAFSALNAQEFTRGDLEERMVRLARSQGARAASGTVRRDVGVFVRSYVGGADRKDGSYEDLLDCPLAELGLLDHEETRATYAFVRGPKDTLPPEVFLFALGRYAETAGSEGGGPATLSFDQLAYGPGSPGRVFKLDEPALAEYLERVAALTRSAWQVTDTAGYRQLVMTRDVDTLAVLDAYYARGL